MRLAGRDALTPFGAGARQGGMAGTFVPKSVLTDIRPIAPQYGFRRRADSVIAFPPQGRRILGSSVGAVSRTDVGRTSVPLSVSQTSVP